MRNAQRCHLLMSVIPGCWDQSAGLKVLPVDPDLELILQQSFVQQPDEGDFLTGVGDEDVGHAPALFSR